MVTSTGTCASAARAVRARVGGTPRRHTPRPLRAEHRSLSGQLQEPSACRLAAVGKDVHVWWFERGWGLGVRGMGSGFATRRWRRKPPGSQIYVRVWLAARTCLWCLTARATTSLIIFAVLGWIERPIRAASSLDVLTHVCRNCGTSYGTDW